MKKGFRMMTALMAVCVTSAAVLTACSTKSNEPAKPSAGGAAQEAKPGSNLPPAELAMAFFTTSSQTQGIAAVQEELSKLTKAKINATVKLVPVSYGSYLQQMNLMQASGEKLDLFVSGLGQYSTQVAQGRLMPLDDLLNKYGSNIKKYVDAPFLDAARINGKLYSIPGIRDLASDRGIAMRKDLIDKYKIDVSKIKTFDDLDAVFKTIKDNEPGVTPLVSYQANSNPADTMLGTKFDNLDDGLGVMALDDSSLKVMNLYDNKFYTDTLNTVRRWYTAGYIPKDAAVTKDNANDLIKAGRAFSYFTTMKPGYAQQASRAAGKEIVTVSFSDPNIVTLNLTRFNWAISNNSKEPERAMMFLDLMYSDKDIINLLAWGIEGKDYVKKSDNMIDYPEGVTASTVQYGLNQGWLFGNQFLSYVFSPDPADLWQQMDKFNKGAIKSKALGFTPDMTSLKTESVAVMNVVNQYKNGLHTGTLDPQSVLPEFNKKLKDAGIDKIIAEKQKQLDEWAKTKKQ
ncbi:ABC transporter substrate-binding protein [Paenibacillus hamazuiensis]|uniref:ABC transporter substrate-binding protein n=1 Tax=Paenibacillus hamazuiensis TaxID=2936508 RepID=UPI0020107898|nr:ABC transporter substrate-binding protein [Paenibacillus hamazuiensis]